jgi:hypothetical protein
MNHYLVFNIEDYLSNWILGAKNTNINEPMEFRINVTSSKSNSTSPVCYNGCSYNGKCISNFQCACNKIYFYKDCSVESEELKPGQFKQALIKKKTYFHFFAFQNSTTQTDATRESVTQSKIDNAVPIKKFLF